MNIKKAAEAVRAYLTDDPANVQPTAWDLGQCLAVALEALAEDEPEHTHRAPVDTSCIASPTLDRSKWCPRCIAADAREGK